MIGSDHLPIAITLNIPCNKKINNHVSIHPREDRFFDWNSLNNYALREISDNAYKIQGSFREEKVHDFCTLECNNKVCIN